MDDDFYDNQSDDWLVQALLSEDHARRDAVAAYLLAKYNPEILRYLRRKLPKHWAELALSEVWEGFYRTIQRQRVRETIRQLLYGIAKYKRADKVKLRAAEGRLEADMPYEIADATTVEEAVELDEAMAYRLGLPYGNSILTPCQRVIWALDTQYEFPRSLISRLLGKSRDTLNTHMSQANHVVREHIEAEQDRITAWYDNPFTQDRQAMADSAVIVENFGSWLIPRLHPEELRPLGLQQAELAENYCALLIVPRWKQESASGTDYGKLALLLVRRDAEAQWRKEADRIARNPAAKRFRFPEACLVEVDVDNEFLNLSVQTLLEVWPDKDSPQHSDNTYLSVHHSPILVPITLGFWDPSLYLDPDLNAGGTVYERWPFLPTDEDWG